LSWLAALDAKAKKLRPRALRSRLSDQADMAKVVPVVLLLILSIAGPGVATLMVVESGWRAAWRAGRAPSGALPR
jgi:hypothetical protein